MTDEDNGTGTGACEAIGEKAVKSLANEIRDEVPPFSLRGRVLDTARSARHGINARPPSASPVEAYAVQVEDLDSTLRVLDPVRWATPVIDDWSVRDVVEHLWTIDGLVVGSEQGDVDGNTSTVHPGNEYDSNERTRQDWRARADALVERCNDEPGFVDRATEFLGLHLTVGQVIIDRTFETWLHAQDVRMALQLDPSTPRPEHLALLTDLAARLIPLSASREPRHEADATVRLVLDDEGGGSWLVNLCGPAPTEPRATVVLDPIEFCYLVGGRRDAYTIVHRVDGDHDLAQDLLLAAASLSRRLVGPTVSRSSTDPFRCRSKPTSASRPSVNP